METTKLGTELRRQLAELVNGGQAHATFDEAAKDFPAELRGGRARRAAVLRLADC